MSMSASEAILMNLIVTSEPLPCPWGLLVSGEPCDGHGCPLCLIIDDRKKKEKQ